MLMRSDASDDPQSGIILYESAPRLRRIHTRRQSLEDYSTAYKNQREGTLGRISTYSSLAV